MQLHAKDNITEKNKVRPTKVSVSRSSQNSRGPKKKKVKKSGGR